MHPFSVPLRDDGMGRSYVDDIEIEAARLAGALLIPKRAAVYAAVAGWTDEQIAFRYGLSEEMIRFRMNLTRARKIAENRASIRTR